MRGEYSAPTFGAPWCGELPPRARRIHPASGDSDFLDGTTSACAENTKRGPSILREKRNYLRVRGEYIRHQPRGRWFEELPPRARRIPPNPAQHPEQSGTTSACAENTLWSVSRVSLARNYLRVRGEYSSFPIGIINNWELPPRARRILVYISYADDPKGTTSACAENTAAGVVVKL